ncbi:MAG: hypothetical protein LDL41_25975 [Coleofasciculus sp. S288]|nr:hypothetical protein [Coleofasciculus sp. S288]
MNSYWFRFQGQSKLLSAVCAIASLYPAKRMKRSYLEGNRIQQLEQQIEAWQALLSKLTSCTWRLKPLSDSEHTNKTCLEQVKKRLIFG